jgi:hypothetical protein
MQLAGCDPKDKALPAVAEHICRHVGCGASVVAEVLEELKTIVTRELEQDAPLDVQFRCRPEALDVSVSARGRELWFTSRRLGS